MEKSQYEYWSRTASFALIVIGILGILFVPIFWAVTDRIVFAFLPFFGTLAGMGQGLNVLKEISQATKGGVGNGRAAEASGNP